MALKLACGCDVVVGANVVCCTPQGDLERGAVYAIKDIDADVLLALDDYEGTWYAHRFMCPACWTRKEEKSVAMLRCGHRLLIKEMVVCVDDAGSGGVLKVGTKYSVGHVHVASNKIRIYGGDANGSDVSADRFVCEKCSPTLEPRFELERTIAKLAKQNALEIQHGGDHYKQLAIQPIEYGQKNHLGACEYSVVKYVTRHRDRGKAEDVKKALHFCQLLLEIEYGIKSKVEYDENTASTGN